MQSKRAIWAGEGIIGVIAIVALFLGFTEITMACVVGIVATLDKLT